MDRLTVLGQEPIAQAAPRIPEVVTDGDSGLLVEPGGLEALRAGLHRMAADRGRWREMGMAGRGIIEYGYNLDLTLDDWARLYAAVASRC